MAKRKRDEDEYQSVDQTDNEKTRQLEKRIVRGIHDLTTSLEQARRFERQKLGRREHDKQRRQRQQDDGNSRKVQVDIALLKAFDMGEIAKKRLHRDLVKTPSIAKTGLLPEDVKLPTGGAAVDKATADLMARLFKQRGVTEALEATLTSVRQILGLNKVDATKKRRQAVSPSPEISKPRKEIVSFSSPSEEEDQEDSEEDSEEDEFLRLASPSDSEPESDAESDVSAPPAKPKPTSSAFLPSLSMTGYMSASDSGSEATDVEDHIAPRKNRRGQRARQAIWEKKFKEKAKHLKEPAKGKKKDKRDDGWDLQRGAVGGKDNGRRRKFGAGSKGPSGANAAALAEGKAKTKHRDDSGPLHPSWVAKKQMKEQKGLGIGGFKGTKMTFD